MITRHIGQLEAIESNYNSTPNSLPAVAFIRVDFNVPLSITGEPSSLVRIAQSRESIRHLILCGYQVVILSHFGQPTTCEDITYSTRKLLPYIEKEYQCSVTPLPYDLEQSAELLKKMKNSGSIYLLENTRLYPGELDNSPDFAKKIASLGDKSRSIYVNDAFSVSHREHASLVALPKLFADRTYQGYALRNELLMLEEHLGGLREKIIEKKKINPGEEEIQQKVICAIIGGKKISTKLPLLRALSHNVEYIFLGGGVANTFALACGQDIGSSLYEAEMLCIAREIMRESRAKIILPSDYIISRGDGEKNAGDNDISTVNAGSQFKGSIGDIGPKTIAVIEQIVQNEAEVVIWSGPMGRYEIDHFAGGSRAVGRILAEATTVFADKIDEKTVTKEEFFINDKLNHDYCDNNSLLHKKITEKKQKKSEEDNHDKRLDNYPPRIENYPHREVISVVGGGDTIAALGDNANRITYCSNAGGAFISWLNGELPALNLL